MPIFVRSEPEVAAFVEKHRPDLVISFGHRLRADEAAKLMPIAELADGYEAGQTYHQFLSDMLLHPVTNATKHPFGQAVRLHEKMEEYVHDPVVLVHCEEGRARSPAMAIMMLVGAEMRRKDLSLKDAIQNVSDFIQDDLQKPEETRCFKHDENMDAIDSYWRMQAMSHFRPQREEPNLAQPVRPARPVQSLQPLTVTRNRTSAATPA